MDVQVSEERERTCRQWRGEKGCGVGNLLDSERGVSNGVDSRGRAGVVEDDRGLLPSLLRYP